MSLVFWFQIGEFFPNLEFFHLTISSLTMALGFVSHLKEFGGMDTGFKLSSCDGQRGADGDWATPSCPRGHTTGRTGAVPRPAV